ncbi:MAG: aminopeptidase P family protein [Cucumibacter sp.]
MKSPVRTAQFQSFEDRTDPANVGPRLAALRREMVKAGISAFLVPRADKHRGENVPPSEERLAWLTGFTGSAGLAIVTLEAAALFVDGRYTLQAPSQTDKGLVAVIEQPPNRPSDWLKDNLKAPAAVGVDPWLLTPEEFDTFEKALDLSGLKLKSVANLIDAIWTDRPAPPATPVMVLEASRAGVSAADKLATIREAMTKAKAAALVLTLPESICWLFNIRGGDVAHTPVTLGFAIVHALRPPDLFLNPAKFTAELQAALGGVELKPDGQMAESLRALGQQKSIVSIDPQNCPLAIKTALVEAGATLIAERDPVLVAKGRKNPAEIAGMRDAHRLDGVAMARFLAWFDIEAPKGELTEIGIVEALESQRRKANSLVDISFETIAGAGAHGAIIHYRVTETSNRRLVPGELMLVDSGGQYREGTTDITRTLSTGAATAAQKEAFTRVLRGVIALSMTPFPKGTTGQQLDTLARQFLWLAGMNYNHGTGHGVGAYLGVHEGPANISTRPSVALEPGMIVSNEPGVYLEGEFGIRTENLILVVESPVGTPERPYYEFETLTLAPIDTRLVEVGLLTGAERDWLNDYHRRVFKEIGDHVEPQILAWLEKATRPI